MKALIGLTAAVCFLVYVFLSCSKNDSGLGPQSSPLVNNKAPVARAGADTSITLPSCGELVTITLDGSSSSDPDKNILSYEWRQLSGPQAYIVNPRYVTTRVDNAIVGEYAFELLVTDYGGLSSRDTFLASIKGTPAAYDLDLAFTGTFRFLNNYVDEYYCGWYGVCQYYDISEIKGGGTHPALGDLVLYFYENADTAANGYAAHSFIQIYKNNINSNSLVGTSTVNLKKLYQQGGGTFSGNFIVNSGSAERCDSTVFKNLAPLNVSGSLDTTTKKVNVRITGKAYL